MGWFMWLVGWLVSYLLAYIQAYVDLCNFVVEESFIYLCSFSAN